MSTSTRQPARDSSRRISGKISTQQHNRDKLGPNSGPMGPEDQRKDKYGSRHNEDAQGLRSEETKEVRKEMSAARSHLRQRRRNGNRK